MAQVQTSACPIDTGSSRTVTYARAHLQTSARGQGSAGPRSTRRDEEARDPKEQAGAQGVKEAGYDHDRRVGRLRAGA